MCPHSSFQTWTPDNVRRTGCLPYMNNTAGDSLLRHVHNNRGLSGVLRLGLVQLVEAGRDVLLPLRRSQVFAYSTLTPAPALITKSSLDVFVGVFHMYAMIFVFLHLSHVRNRINIALSLAIFPAENLNMGSFRRSYQDTKVSYQEAGRENWRKSLSSHSDICFLTYSPSRDYPEII